MIEETWYYLLINLFVILIPLMRSFEPRIAYAKSFKALFAGIFVAMLLFIPWDVIFTINGFWGFNPRYLSGVYLFSLPLGEWMFFVTVPFACVFIYRVLNYFIKNDVSPRMSGMLNNFLITFSFAFAVFHYDKWYTFITFLLLGAFLSLHQYFWRTWWLGNFYRAYLVILIPFFLVNGILTGSWIEEEIVWYNPEQMMGTRIGTVPFEDAFYGMLLILLVTTVYEQLRHGGTLGQLVKGETSW